MFGRCSFCKAELSGKQYEVRINGEKMIFCPTRQVESEDCVTKFLRLLRSNGTTVNDYFAAAD